jgi:hypothetical protein
VKPPNSGASEALKENLEDGTGGSSATDGRVMRWKMLRLSKRSSHQRNLHELKEYTAVSPLQLSPAISSRDSTSEGERWPVMLMLVGT